jgi:hypothetical protein
MANGWQEIQSTLAKHLGKSYVRTRQGLVYPTPLS